MPPAERAKRGVERLPETLSHALDRLEPMPVPPRANPVDPLVIAMDAGLRPDSRTFRHRAEERITRRQKIWAAYNPPFDSLDSDAGRLGHAPGRESLAENQHARYVPLSGTQREPFLPECVTTARYLVLMGVPMLSSLL